MKVEYYDLIRDKGSMSKTALLELIIVSEIENEVTNRRIAKANDGYIIDTRSNKKRRFIPDTRSMLKITNLEKYLPLKRTHIHRFLRNSKLFMAFNGYITLRSWDGVSEPEDQYQAAEQRQSMEPRDIAQWAIDNNEPLRPTDRGFAEWCIMKQLPAKV